MVGQERTVLPLMATQIFGLTGIASALTFLVAFGMTKALTNLAAGLLADRYGRRPVLIAGWLVGVPVPLLLIWAPSWEWVVVANVLLGINQGLTWSVAVMMKIDLVGPRRRGLALGLNEAAGYSAVAVTALVTGVHRRSGGPPTSAVRAGARGGGRRGWSCRRVAIRETRDHVSLEHGLVERAARPSWRTVVIADQLQPSVPVRREPGRSRQQPQRRDGVGPAAALLRGGWPAAHRDRRPRGGVPADVGTCPARDRRLVRPDRAEGADRRRPARSRPRRSRAIAGTSGFWPWFGACIGLGLGTAMVYPTLLAAVADVADPAWRGSALGVYRMWRDLGFAAGAILVGVMADRAGMPAAIAAVAAITAGSGVIVAVRMRETHPGLTAASALRGPDATMPA